MFIYGWNKQNPCKTFIKGNSLTLRKPTKHIANILLRDEKLEALP